MKKNIILGLVVVGSLLVAPFAHAKEKEVVVATAIAGDVHPFSFEKKGQLTGYDIEVLKAADELMDDYRFSFKKTS